MPNDDFTLPYYAFVVHKNGSIGFENEGNESRKITYIENTICTISKKMILVTILNSCDLSCFA